MASHSRSTHDALLVERFFQTTNDTHASHLTVCLSQCADSRARHPAVGVRSYRASMLSLASGLMNEEVSIHLTTSAPLFSFSTHLLAALTRPTHGVLKVRGALFRNRTHQVVAPMASDTQPPRLKEPCVHDRRDVQKRVLLLRRAKRFGKPNTVSQQPCRRTGGGTHFLSAHQRAVLGSGFSMGRTARST